MNERMTMLRARRDQLAAELAAVEDEIDQSDCRGPGRCHGCLSWCDECGDVSRVCDALRCDKHRCISCNEIRPPEVREWWSYVCHVCEPDSAHWPLMLVSDHCFDKVDAGHERYGRFIIEVELIVDEIANASAKPNVIRLARQRLDALVRRLGIV